MPAQSPTLSPTLSAIGRVARVVLGDTGLNLAHQVGTHVGGLGEDTAANTHEHGQQRCTEAEALENLGGVTLVDEHDRGSAQQAQAHGHHADGATGAEGDAHALVASGVVRGRGDAHVGLDRETHAEVTDRGGEDRSEHEEAGTTEADPGGVGWQSHQQEEDDHDEDGQRLELPRQIGVGTLLDC